MFTAPTTSACSLVVVFSLDQEKSIVRRGSLKIALEGLMLVHPFPLTLRAKKCRTWILFKAALGRAQEPLVVSVDAHPGVITFGSRVLAKPSEAVLLARTTPTAHQDLRLDYRFHVQYCAQTVPLWPNCCATTASPVAGLRVGYFAPASARLRTWGVGLVGRRRSVAFRGPAGRRAAPAETAVTSATPPAPCSGRTTCRFRSAESSPPRGWSARHA